MAWARHCRHRRHVLNPAQTLQWQDEPDLPLHLALGRLARHLIAMLAQGTGAAVFGIVKLYGISSVLCGNRKFGT